MPDPLPDPAHAASEGPRPPPTPAAAAEMPAGAPEVEPLRMWSPDEPVSSPLPSPPVGKSTKKPVLASEALIEDVAPVAPLRAGARALCAAIGIVFGLIALLPLVGLRDHTRPVLVPSLFVALAMGGAAAARMTYRTRAFSMVALGSLVALLGLTRVSLDLSAAPIHPAWGFARWVAAVALPAALFFRARYRAFPAVRALLGVAFALTLPLAAHAIGVLATDDSFGFATLGSTLVLVALLASAIGFMGAETTGAGATLAPIVLTALALHVGLLALGAVYPGALTDLAGLLDAAPLDDAAPPAAAVHAAHASLAASGWADIAGAMVAFAASAALAALGAFQLLASRFAQAARRIDPHRPVPAGPDDRPSHEDWSTRA